MHYESNNKRYHKPRAIILIALCCFLVYTVVVSEKGRVLEAEQEYPQVSVLTDFMETFFPLHAFTDEAIVTTGFWQNVLASHLCNSPLYLYSKTGYTWQESREISYTYDMIVLQEGSDEDYDSMMFLALEEENEEPVVSHNQAQEVVVVTNEPETMEVSSEEIMEAVISENTAGGFFVAAEEKSMEYNMADLQDFSYLLSEFYIVDSGTTVMESQLNVQNMLAMDMHVEKETQGPQILIYHTHSAEAFADSVPGDYQDTIMGAGELLAEILREEYGYQVLHHTGQYDVERHDYAYSNAEPEIERILRENPDIEVVIDLHRDEVTADRKLVTWINGEPVAQVMFFNGLSYVNELGPIDYLENPNLSANLAFSFQMQLAANEYYPGFTRRIYLKGYRYNMHLAEKYLLIELGAQTNTVEEIRNACYPLADVLNRVISAE